MMKVDVIIPAFNEEDSIEKVILEIPKELVREIIVCDNNSTDGTSQRAKDSGATVLFEGAQGYGNACLKGMTYIAEKQDPPDVIVFMDGDYSDYPEEMRQLLAPIQHKAADLVIGSRALGRMERGSMTPQQIFGNWLATSLLKIFYGYKFTDLGPFRAIKYQKLLELKMQDKTYGWTVEMQIKAAKNKFVCTEVPVNYRRRIGVSKVSGTVKGTILAGHKILWTLFKNI